MRDDEALAVSLLADACLTLEELARAGAVSQEWIMHRTTEGMLCRTPAQAGELRYTRADLWRVRRMVAIERDFDAVPELAALVADLLEEVDALRARLRRAGLE